MSKISPIPKLAACAARLDKDRIVLHVSIPGRRAAFTLGEVQLTLSNAEAIAVAAAVNRAMSELSGRQRRENGISMAEAVDSLR